MTRNLSSLLLTLTIVFSLLTGCSGKAEPVAAQTVEAGPTGPVGRLLVITLDTQGQILMGGETYDLEAFTAAYPARLGEMTQSSTVLRVAPELSDEQVKPVLQAIAAAGVDKVYVTKIQVQQAAPAEVEPAAALPAEK